MFTALNHVPSNGVATGKILGNLRSTTRQLDDAAKIKAFFMQNKENE